MKIACLCTRYHVAGASTNAALLAREFSKRDHPSETWFIHRAGEMPPSGVNERIFLDAAPQRRSEWRHLWYELLSSIDEFQPDVIVGFHPLANALGATASAMRRKRFVGTQRNPADSQRRSLRIADHLLGSLPTYASNICVSNSVRESYGGYSRAYRRKIRVVYNGLRPLARPTCSQLESRVNLGLPRGDKLIGSIGRLHFQKNIDLIIHALAATPFAHLAIAGEGEDERDLRSIVEGLGIADRVHFLGNLTNDAVGHFYNAIDIFAMPSRYEGFGLTLIEALSFGLPAVVSAIPVLEEVSGGAAIHCAFDPAIWSSEFQRLANDPDMRASMHTRAINRANAFSIEAMVDGYLEAFRECL